MDEIERGATQADKRNSVGPVDRHWSPAPVHAERKATLFQDGEQPERLTSARSEPQTARSLSRAFMSETARLISPNG